MFEPDFNIEPDPLEIARDRVWTVSAVTARLKSLIETNPTFQNIRVRGEITNLSASKAGHIYFGIKDPTSYLKCVAFRGSALKLRVKPVDGMEIIVSGRINVWEAGGSYQLIVDEIEEVGLGALWLQFEETRKKLAEEGLFDEKRKRPLPLFPRKIGIVTSQTGAAVRDIIRVFNDRAPYLRIIISPSLVQGETAPASLIRALDLLETWDEIERSEGRDGIDLIIIGRGGGSFEDLACFNDEQLVRRITKTRVPVISAVGHEVDFTIIDFAADVRAATPTQAAQLAARSSDEIMTEISGFIAEFRQAVVIRLETYRTGLSNILSRPIFVRPLDRIYNLRQNLDNFTGRSGRAAVNRVRDLRHCLASVVNRLEALNPNAILQRGYSLAFNRNTGSLITRTGHVNPGTPVELRVSDGYIKLTADEKKES